MAKYTDIPAYNNAQIGADGETYISDYSTSIHHRVSMMSSSSGKAFFHSPVGEVVK